MPPSRSAPPKAVRLVRWLSGVLCFAGLGVETSPASSSDRHTESFTTTTYRDPLFNRAFWDTAAGNLRLPLFLPSLVGSWDTPGSANGIDVEGDLAFIADEASGLQIIKISTASLLGTINTPGIALGVSVSGNLALVADDSAGLLTVDITNPAGPTQLGALNTPGSAMEVSIDGNRAFVADGSSGVLVIEISDPALPTLLGTYNTPGTAYDVAVNGDMVVVADGGGGLQLLDITDPSNPALLGSYATPGSALGVDVSGDLAFVAAESFGLLVVDITDPTSPVGLGALDTPGYSYKVAVAGDRALVADKTEGLQIIDITDPAIPKLAASVDTPGTALHVVVAGSRAFLADADFGLQIANIAAPAVPRGVALYFSPAAGARGIAVSGDLAFSVDSSQDLTILNIQDPENPLPVSTLATPGNAVGVVVAGDLAYLATMASGLQIVDIADPTAPALVGAYDTPGSAQGVTVAGDLAFVADGTAGLHIIDIADPTAPALVGTFNSPGEVFDVALSGSLALVADGNALRIIDIAGPSSPFEVGAYSLPSAYGVAVTGDLALVAGGNLQILDISDPGTPALLGQVAMGNAVRLAVDGSLAFVVDQNTGLHVVDLNSPYPVLGSFGPVNAEAVTVAGDYVFLVDDVGFRVVEVLSQEFETLNNRGLSRKVNLGTDLIVAARLSSTQTAGVTWAISANGGSSWQSVTPGVWHSITTEGNNLRWESIHLIPAGGTAINPTVEDLTIDWLHEFPRIISLRDIPGDQGGWVRLQLTRSGRDLASEPDLPIAQYGVWRRVDSAALVAALASGAWEPARIEPSVAKAFEPLQVMGFAGRVFTQAGSEAVAAALPPGTWELVATIPALQAESYLAAIPTEADSATEGTHYMTVVVTAHTTTPTIWYASPPDSGYSVDNIAPGVPSGFAVAYGTGSGNALSWDPSLDDDFQYFRVYRGEDPDFIPSTENLLHSTAATEWLDSEYNGGLVHYKVTALDHSGNESVPASPGTVTGVRDLPSRGFVLEAAWPNPFGLATRITYQIPEDGTPASIRIYDALGRTVRTLVEGVQTAGIHSATWDGRDQNGRRLGSGVYFYRLIAPRNVLNREVVLTR